MDNRKLRQIDKEIKVIVEQSASSFFMAMKILPKKQKRAMYAVYSFCRVIDDIVDEVNEISKKQQMLKFWKDEIDNIYLNKKADTSIGEAILYSITNGFDFPKTEFINIINGVGMDIPDPINRPSYERLLKYCRGVAVAPGVLCMYVFGFKNPYDMELARYMGNALQMTNILRDTKEDALIDRCYIPDEYLKNAGIKGNNPRDIIIDNKLYVARQKLAIRAMENYDMAYKKIATLDKKKIKPAKLILSLYKEYYDIMKNRGWEAITPKPKLSKLKKLKLMFNIFILGK